MHSRINNCQLNLNRVVAAGCYFTGFGLIATACGGLLADPFADLGLGVVIVGVVRTFSGWLDEMDDREQNAFELGRDHEAERVRSIR